MGKNKAEKKKRKKQKDYKEEVIKKQVDNSEKSQDSKKGKDSLDLTMDEKKTSDSKSIKKKIGEFLMKKKPFKKTFVFLGLFILIFIVLVPVSIYQHTPLGDYTKPLLRNLPYPVALVGDNFEMVSTIDLIRNSESVQKFYEDQDFSSQGLRVDFTTEDGKKRLEIKQKDVLDKLIENLIIKQLAIENGLEVTPDDAQAEIEYQIEKAGSRRSLELKLKSLYGWGVDDFRDNVVVYQMYLKGLSLVYLDKSKEQDVYQKIVQAREEMKDDGANFAEIAEKFSDGDSSENGGELGWFSKDQLVPELSEKVFELEKGEISKIIVTPLGFHIVQLEDMREIEKNVSVKTEKEKEKGTVVTEKRMVKEAKIRQVFIKGKNLLEWIDEKKKEAKVLVWMKEYKWNPKLGKIQFRDEEKRKMEKIIRKRSVGDPTFKY